MEKEIEYLKSAKIDFAKFNVIEFSEINEFDKIFKDSFKNNQDKVIYIGTYYEKSSISKGLSI